MVHEQASELVETASPPACGAITLEDWARWRRAGHRRLPLARRWAAEERPLSWERFAAGPASVLLESGLGGRFTYLCDRPQRVLLGRADAVEIRSGDCSTLVETRVGNPLEVLQAILAEERAPALPGWPAMCGGLIGVFGYDVVHTWERFEMRARRDLPLPLYAMIEPRELFVHDGIERTLTIIVWRDAGTVDVPLAQAFDAAERAIREAHDRWRQSGVRPSAHTRPASDALPAEPIASFSAEGFREAVQRAQAYIAAGHTYQVNLSLRTARPAPQAAEAIYEALRRVNPSPYMGFLRLPQFALVCGSPELLVRQVGGSVSSRPIAGTRPRGRGQPEDSHLCAELVANEKERAEHLMLVDLIRNDIGRVAEFGSVQVPEFMAVERYSHVMHLVSQVEGRLARGKTWVDTFRSMFPGGTITGCPKFRTMEIIEELEPVGRGFYTGALGWISYAGDMEMNIVIRSMLVHEGVAYVQAGAGIVADSDPARELDESRRKAQALWVALEASCPGHQNG